MTPFVLSPELYLTFIIIAATLDFFIGSFNFIHSPLHVLSFLSYLFIIPFARLKDNRVMGLLALILFLITTFIVITFLLIFIYQINYFLYCIFYIWCLTACLGEKRLNHRTQIILEDLNNQELAHLRELLSKIFKVQTETLTKKELCRLALESTAVDGITEILAPLLSMIIGVFTIVILPYINPLIMVAFYKGLNFFSWNSEKLGYKKEFNYASNSTLRILNYFVFYLSTYSYIIMGGFSGLNTAKALEAFNEIREKSHFSSYYPIAAVGGLFGLPIVTSTSSDETIVVGLKETKIYEEDLSDLMKIIELSEIIFLLFAILFLFIFDVLRDNL